MTVTEQSLELRLGTREILEHVCHCDFLNQWKGSFIVAAHPGRVNEEPADRGQTLMAVRHAAKRTIKQ